jgi:hypothetical protein
MDGEGLNVNTKHKFVFISVKVVHMEHVPREHLLKDYFRVFLGKGLLETSLKHYTWHWHTFLEENPHK